MVGISPRQSDSGNGGVLGAGATQLRARPAKSSDGGEEGGAAGGDVAGDEDGDDREDGGPEIMAPIPGDQKMVRVDQAADADGNLGDAPG